MTERLTNNGGLFDLHGRIALVTGGAGWLGAPMVAGLAEAGAHVVIVGRRVEPLHDLANELIGQGLSAEPYALDVRDAAATRVALEHLEQVYGRLDIVVNNASSAPPGPRGLDAPDDSFADATEINITAAWRLTTKALPLLRAAVRSAGEASVINIGSMYGKISPDPRVYQETGEPPNPAFYGAAKAGLLQMTRWLAANLGPERIRVNSISPGPFPQWNARERAPEFVTKLDGKTLLGRVGNREEIKGAVVFLASRASSYVTGADLAVDGGWTAW
jgi:NAD(P)-dependent dehydrogenase (short-subunit alcohol dehydrogenase family)